jgi:hypothetical protein
MQGRSNKRVMSLGILLGFLAAFPFMAVAGFLYLRYGHPPVAVADPPFPDEETIVHIPLDARINRDGGSGMSIRTDEYASPLDRTR